MDLINTLESQNEKRPLKRAMSGFEVEMHILKSNGSMSYKGFDLVQKVKKKYPEVDVVKECGKNMLELGCYPDINSYNPALEIINSIEKVIEVAKENKLIIFPFSTYPGLIKTKLTPDTSGKYELQKKIFGKEKFSLATKVVGFHHHYAFPKGVFDYNKKELKLLLDSKLKRSLINSYNLEIAIDPILSLLTQSSPFFEGEILAKNSRILVYRGGKKLKYPGLYDKLQTLGALPPYKQTATDLISSLKLREKKWAELVKKVDSKIDFRKIYPYNLDISWNPVKINKHGTLEQRGLDINYMSTILGVSALIKFTLKKIQRDFIEVIPSDKGITNSFKIKEGIMFIPPQTYIRKKLQKASAYEGFANKELYEYTKRFYRLAKSLCPEVYKPLLKKVESMIKKKRSLSDEMLTLARRKKWVNKKGKIPPIHTKKFARYYSEKFEKDLIETKQIVEEIITTHKNIKQTTNDN
ncbi:hypothetical protein HQ533_01825 [Candidatus Woesearchaeota archaeon]|nr:hypothetical protein [Candidatus Woesearchaeota archaeon]